MGLTNAAVGIKAVDAGLTIKKQSETDRVVALAGNPNVGKSTVFNNLTGLNQHTGNWPGKTVTNAQGYCATAHHSYVMVDIPGTYSLMAHSAEEEVARNFLCFGDPDAVVVVCDATCLERNLNLVLQTLEISDRVVVCVNLMDEARRKNIRIDLAGLSKQLGVPVIGTIARRRKTLDDLMRGVDRVIDAPPAGKPLCVRYPKAIEDAIAVVEPVVARLTDGRLRSRWLSLRLLDRDPSLLAEIDAYFGEDLLQNEELIAALDQAGELLAAQDITADRLKDQIVSSLVLAAEEVCMDTVTRQRDVYNSTDQRIDRVLTSKWAGYPLMLALLAVVFWLTITGANYPSQLLADALFWVQERLTDVFHYFGAPEWLHGMLVLGVYRVLAWVVSVMLPPMAIFFPLFTLLEDAGYLPRVAYNLDQPFKRCHACGKQALTMCMGEKWMRVRYLPVYPQQVVFLCIICSASGRVLCASCTTNSHLPCRRICVFYKSGLNIGKMPNMTRSLPHFFCKVIVF